MSAIWSSSKRASSSSAAASSFATMSPGTSRTPTSVAARARSVPTAAGRFDAMSDTVLDTVSNHIVRFVPMEHTSQAGRRDDRSPRPDLGTFGRFVSVVERRAWWVIAAWVAAAVVLTLAAPSLNDVGSQDTADFLPSDAPSQQADRILAETFPGDPTREAAIIVAARQGGLTEPDRVWLGQLVDDLRGPEFAGVVRGVQSAVSD